MSFVRGVLYQEFYRVSNDTCTRMLSLQDNGKGNLISRLIGLQPPIPRLSLRGGEGNTAKSPHPPTECALLSTVFCHFYCFVFLSSTVRYSFFPEMVKFASVITPPKCIPMYIVHEMYCIFCVLYMHICA